MIVLTAGAMIFNWSQRNWQRHPITQNLMKFSNDALNYEALANDIAVEIRR